MNDSFIVFTTINHKFRKEFGLSLNEYVLCDIVRVLSVSLNNKMNGWCYLSREKLANEIGVSRQTINTLINSLEEKGMLIKNNETRFLRHTLLFEQSTLQDVKKLYTTENFNANDVKKFDTGCKETLQDRCKETLHKDIYNIRNIDKINNEDVSKVFSDEKTSHEKDLFSDLKTEEKPKEKSSAKKEKVEDVLSDVIDYLNERRKTVLPSSKGFEKNASNFSHLKTRVKEGYVLGDFTKVIDSSIIKWGKNSEMSIYIRPSTLFGTKFSQYLTESDYILNKPNDGGNNFEIVDMSNGPDFI